jgi:hypothetical protein
MWHILRLQEGLTDGEEVATYRNLRRGRQSFIIALGFIAARRYARYAEPLAAFLHEHDGGGQVLDTLIKMNSFAFCRSGPRANAGAYF